MSTIVIKEASISDYDIVWKEIKDIAPSECGKRINDYNIYHSENSLERVLSDSSYREKVLIAKRDDKVTGVADFTLCRPDYLFFENEFGYIRYLVADDDETRKALYDAVKERLKKSKIRYVAKDVWNTENEEYENLSELGMKKHRTRLFKELKKEDK